jgi:NAD(P)-dependent dehydrogenase (short-subunit alcohol dehydrogenase family)
MFGPAPGVVITGGTRGIGHGLAKAFLDRGARVVISGRDSASLEAALAALSDLRAGPPAQAIQPSRSDRPHQPGQPGHSGHPSQPSQPGQPGQPEPGQHRQPSQPSLPTQSSQPGQPGQSTQQTRDVRGCLCDVQRWTDVQGLWNFAERELGAVDIWINNAGIGQPQTDITGLDPERIASIFATNCTGALYGCKVAMTGMRPRRRGAIYNLEGLGSKGELIRGMTAYAASKQALAYMRRSLALEARGSGVIVGALMPGMTATDLIIQEYRGRPEAWAKVRTIFNILSDRVETIAPWLVDCVLANQRNGARIAWLTSARAAWRFMSAPLVKRRIYPDIL